MSSLSLSSTIKLNDNTLMPVLGLGTWLSKPGEVSAAVEHAIKNGYRHLDCAAVYHNEKEVGEGLKAGMAAANIKREDMWITSKLWLTQYHPNRVRPALQKTLTDLGVTYLDQYLLHYPMPLTNLPDGSDIPIDKKNKWVAEDLTVDYCETWAVLEQCQKEGLIKSIGVSNCAQKHLERLKKTSTVTPAVNQCECHPYLPQSSLQKYMKSENITMVAYCPFGSKGLHPAADPCLKNPAVEEVAKEVKKSAAQTLLRWGLQKNHVVIPKSVTPARIEENKDLFDFELNESQMSKIDSIPKVVRQLNPNFGREKFFDMVDEK